jgi:hypothetical protein
MEGGGDFHDIPFNILGFFANPNGLQSTKLALEQSGLLPEA